jgi:hypothetical protein
MSFPKFPGRRMNRTDKPNIKLEDIPMNSLITILTTSRGWIIRQALKGITVVTAPLAVWLSEHGAGEHTGAIIAGITAVVSAAIEIGLSYLARKNK